MAPDPLHEPLPGAPEPEPELEREVAVAAPEPSAVALPFADDLVMEKPNAALDALVARDAALVVEPAPAVVAEAEPAPLPMVEHPPATKVQEWAAAIVLMVLFAAFAFALMSFFRS